MTINQQTLLLDQQAWDLVLDGNGNIASANAPYSIAQDVASAVRTFKGECWYNNSLGVPYWKNILGAQFSPSLAAQEITDQALTIPNVSSAKTTFQSFTDRHLVGQVLIIDKDGFETGVNFNE